MDELEKKKQQTQQINPAVAASLRGAFSGQPAAPKYDWRGILDLINPFNGPKLGDTITEQLKKKK